jgi:hypothetical protein
LMNTFNQIPINLRREAAKRAKLNVWLTIILKRKISSLHQSSYCFQGNMLFESKKYTEAIECYTQALTVEKNGTYHLLFLILIYLSFNLSNFICFFISSPQHAKGDGNMFCCSSSSSLSSSLSSFYIHS